MRLAVIDGQGGGIGTAIIKKVVEAHGDSFEIWALGANAIATAQMMKAGANRGATGENAIRQCAPKVQVIAGPISILLCHSMMGEVTPAMVEAIGSSPAMKIILPITQDPIAVVGTSREPLPHLVDRLVFHHLADLLGTQEKHT